MRSKSAIFVYKVMTSQSIDVNGQHKGNELCKPCLQGYNLPIN